MMATLVHSRQIWSPDRTARIEANESLDLFDEHTQTMLTIIPQTRGTNEIHVEWSRNSQKVVIAQDLGKGSVVYGAWYDGRVWHKTIQTEQDFSPVVRVIEQMAHSTVESESRKFIGWTGPDTVRVQGTLRLRNGKQVVYEYRLAFVAQTGRYDRGGYEEGVITSSEYKTL